MKLAVVVQRYGADLNGGAELHARYIAQRLARHSDVEVLTTCARDYITWRNELPEGVDEVNGVLVRRFSVSQERDPYDFALRSDYVFGKHHSIADELKWLRAEGPTSPTLVNYLRQVRTRYDYVVFFSYRYYHTYHGMLATSDRAILVPTAERDPALGLSIFGQAFRTARAVMYNSYEERALIHSVANNKNVPAVVVGVGSEIPTTTNGARFRARTGLKGSFALYVGRIDENKGCGEMFDYFRRYHAQVSQTMQLVLIGNPIIPIPAHPRIRHLGFVTDEEKYDAMEAADLLIMPSYYESLSMVTIEAWAMRTPVLVNGRCDVLRGQTIRANAGLYYESFDEFAESLRTLETNKQLRNTFAADGRAYYERHYTWDVIDAKYLGILSQLQKIDRDGYTVPVHSKPGWLKQHRHMQPPARKIVDDLPTGPTCKDVE